jgi:hypothetical protein
MALGRRRVSVVMSLVMILGSTSGCATIIHGRSQDVDFASTPPGATVKVDGLQATTPGKVTLKRKKDYDVVFTKKWFPDRPVKIESTGSWWMLGNAFFGGIIGLIIDLSTGGGYKLVPASIDMDFATGTTKEVEKKEEMKQEEKK